MTLRVGINGFGRIGRNVLRAIIESQREDIKVVAINNRSSIQVCAHLLKYDSIKSPKKPPITIKIAQYQAVQR